MVKAPGRRGSRQQRDTPHATHERLVSSALELIHDCPPESVTIAMVQEHSGVSRGSLYHHFEDLADLLETAMVRAFAKVVDSNIALMAELLENASTPAQFYEATKHFNAVTQSPERRGARFERIRWLGFAYLNKRFADRLAKEQNRLTESYANLFRTAQARGLMSETLDPYAASILIQAYSLGKAVDEIGTSQLNEEVWNSLLMQIVTDVFGVSAGN